MFYQEAIRFIHFYLSGSFECSIFFLSLYPKNFCAHFRIGYPIHPLLNKGFENGIVNRIVYLVKKSIGHPNQKTS